MTPVRLPTILPLVAAATLTLGLSACGGGDDGGGGDPTAYGRTYERACKRILDSPNRVQEQLRQAVADAGSDQAKAVAAIKRAAGGMFDDLGRQLDAMAAADAPGEFADFQRSVVDGRDRARAGIAEAQAKIDRMRTLADLSAIGPALSGIDFGSSQALPAKLAERAPSCRRIMQR